MTIEKLRYTRGTAKAGYLTNRTNMRSEHSANLNLQTKHVGKTPTAKKQGKHDTIGTMITSWTTKFVVVLVAVVVVKHFFF